MLEIKVGQGSCGISAGAGKVYDALQSALDADVKLSVTGCIGMCFLEPIVDIYDDGKLTRLVHVQPKDAQVRRTARVLQRLWTHHLPP